MSFTGKINKLKSEKVKIPTYRLFKFNSCNGGTVILLTTEREHLAEESNAMALVVASDSDTFPVGYQSNWSLKSNDMVTPFIGEVILTQDAV